jgi:hypothetical protein
MEAVVEELLEPEMFLVSQRRLPPNPPNHAVRYDTDTVRKAYDR